jgi:phosphatidylglycerol:prolipoprotein diacylglycerol transferase
MFLINIVLRSTNYNLLHFPFNIPVGKSEIPIHFLCETLAYAVGYRYYTYLRRNQQDTISDSNRLIIFIGAAIGAFLGSHCLGILENPVKLQHIDWIYFMGNTTIIGGLLGGLVGVELTKKRIGITVSSGDLMVYPIIVSMLIGRTGCFLAGLTDGTYGTPSNLPWAINFGDGIRRHPTNLYEILFWLVLWLALSRLEKEHELANGARFKLLMVCYLLFRLCVEFIKPAYFFNFGLSVLQLACLAGLAYYYKVFLYPSKNLKAYA